LSTSTPHNSSPDTVVVGRIGRPHGVRGEVTVEVRTDDPELRFAPGSVLVTDPARVGPLTVEAVRWHSGRLLLRVEGVADRTAAEGLRGVVVCAEVPDDEVPADPEEYYDHQLRGLAVVTVEGDAVGEVSDVIHLPAQDLLAIARPGGRELLVPFVSELVPEIDLGAGRAVIDPPPGLLDLDLPDADATPADAGEGAAP
jgi:16S rRNA processing protein RimM